MFFRDMNQAIVTTQEIIMPLLVIDRVRAIKAVIILLWATNQDKII